MGQIGARLLDADAGVGDARLDAWEGAWVVAACDGLSEFLEDLGAHSPRETPQLCDETVLHRLRVRPDAFTVEHHVPEAGVHALFCADFAEDFRSVATGGSSNRLSGVCCLPYGHSLADGGDRLTWRHSWIEAPVSFKTEILDFFGVQGHTLQVERRLLSAGELWVTLSVSDGRAAVAGPCAMRLKKVAMRGPCPVAFLRRYGRPLDTTELRLQALRDVSRMVAEHTDEISAAQERDRVFPSRFNGVAQMLIGGSESYQKLVAEWMAPEALVDACPQALQAGVAADWAVVNEPKGVCINISPWNAPVQLSLIPALAMLAAGNRVVVKPPDLVPSVSRLLRRLCETHLDGCVWVEEGGREVVERLIDEGADHLVFTGGGEIAKVVAARCASMLTPVTLELGGKSPVFLDASLDDAMLDAAVREILETKLHKTGQFCCAHDYALVHEGVFPRFCEKFEAAVQAAGERRNVAIIARRQYEALRRKLDESGAACLPALGGRFVPDDEAMTLPVSGLLAPALDASVLSEEIFGPLLPIIRVRDVDEAIYRVNSVVTGKPLIAYCYSQDPSAVDAFIAKTSSGNVAVNSGPQRLLCNFNAAFGGIGASGSGVSMWGREAMREFSNRKHVVRARGGFAKSFFSGPPPAAS